MDRLSMIRQTLHTLGVDAFLLPMSDAYLGEYVPDADRRLEWLSGFSGSAGLAVVTQGEAMLLTDGRYTLQARMECPGWEIINSAERKVEDVLPRGVVTGYDPWLHSIREAERYGKHCTLKPLTPNPVDALWESRPPAPDAPAFMHALEYAGESAASKRARVAEKLKERGADYAVLAASDSVNWLLNLRGRDLAFTPVIRAYAVIAATGEVTLFADAARMPAEVEARVVPLSALEKELRMLQGTVLLDAALTPAWFAQSVRAEILRADDPCQAMKALKNATELAGIRAAHVRDGLAVTRFLHWLESARGVTEMQAMEKLLDFRKAAPEFFSQSFETIAGSGAHGAIVHYRADAASNRALADGELFLLDSGGQYPDGTTDITRTVAIGTPNDEQRARFTEVLKGHIALASALFPEGTSGAALDVLARQFLWLHGRDYDHGTGHGVGHFLGVHEGPQRIGKRGGDTALKPGMILSNEPGYYKEGAYGIRMESLVAVERRGLMENGKELLGFETLTLAPIDRRLIDVSLLTSQEKDWIDAYHARVLAAHAPHLAKGAAEWLARCCAAIED